MERYLEQWLKDNGYKLYAEAKGYYVYENDKFTIVIDEHSVLRLFKPKN